MKAPRFFVKAWLTAAVLAGPVSVAGASQSAFPGLGEPGRAVGLLLQGSGAAQDALKILGPDERLQLVVTASFDSGQHRDWTRGVKYRTEPAGIVEVSATGLVRPLGDGRARVFAAHEGLEAWVEIEVSRYQNPPAVNFPNQVVPLFTKFSCNSGGCHGKSGGQNGFRLSLLGFEPEKDYEYLVQEARGRRLFPAAPDHSLLLLKAINQVPHGGGAKLDKDSPDYQLLRRWIEQGMPYGSKEDPVVTQISVEPRHRLMPLDGEQQIVVMAHYSDGSVRPVTGLAQYESNNKDLAEVDPAGRVKAMGRAGDVAVMARYQSHVAVFQATVPLGVKVDGLPEPANFVDREVFRKLRELGLPPSELSSDSQFFRRVHLDIAGRLPDAVEAEAFLADPDPQKRAKVIDRLLASDGYADYFANKWAAVLRVRRGRDDDQRAGYLFHDWIRTALQENMPYDRFVGQILAASGSSSLHPAVTWFRQVSKSSEQVEDMAQLFLGVRIQCARCHHHPFEKWSQEDYYGLEAFFSRVGTKPDADTTEVRVFHRRGKATAKHPGTGKDIPATPLGAGAPLELSNDDDPRLGLMAWMRSSDNRFFARTLVNRYWKHFFGRGLVDPEDDMRETNPPTNPQLLDALAQSFIESGYDLKHLVRTICNSRTYQLSSQPNAWNASDTQSFSRYYPRRLNAESLLDAIDQFTASTTNYGALPVGMRAMQIPDHGSVNVYFLQVFGRPEGASACECERTGDASLAQSLHLLNSQEVQAKVSSARVRALAADKDRPDEQKIRELYLAAFARPPEAGEMETALSHIQKLGDKGRQIAYEDIVWALINTKEFLFNH